MCPFKKPNVPTWPVMFSKCPYWGVAAGARPTLKLGTLDFRNKLVDWIAFLSAFLIHRNYRLNSESKFIGIFLVFYLFIFSFCFFLFKEFYFIFFFFNISVTGGNALSEIFFKDKSKSYDTFAVAVINSMFDIGSTAINNEPCEHSLWFYFIGQFDYIRR